MDEELAEQRPLGDGRMPVHSLFLFSPHLTLFLLVRRRLPPQLLHSLLLLSGQASRSVLMLLV